MLGRQIRRRSMSGYSVPSRVVVVVLVVLAAELALERRRRLCWRVGACGLDPLQCSGEICGRCLRIGTGGKRRKAEGCGDITLHRVTQEEW